MGELVKLVDGKGPVEALEIFRWFVGEKRDTIENWGTNAHLNFLHFVNAIVGVEGSPFKALATDVEDRWAVLDNVLQ